MMLGFFFKYSCWLANGFIELVNKQRQNSLTHFSHFMITGVIGFGGFHIGNIEVFELFYTQTQLQF
jgi:hypothetical protein